VGRGAFLPPGDDDYHHDLNGELDASDCADRSARRNAAPLSVPYHP